MKLYEFKTKYIQRLALYEPKSEREQQLREQLIVKLSQLRSVTLANLAFTLYEIVEYEKVSNDFKDLCKRMLVDIGKIESGD